MLAREAIRWQTLERWSPTLFLLGGGGVITHAAVQALEAFTTVTPPPDVFVTTGHLLALVGLLGLKPALAERTPRLAAVGLSVTAISATAWVVLTAGQFLAVTGAVDSMAALFPTAYFFGVLGVSILAYTLVGAAALRDAERSTVDGLLILAPAVLLAFLMGKAAVVGVTPVDGVVIGTALAVSMVALGVRLQSWPGAMVDSGSAGVVSG